MSKNSTPPSANKIIKRLFKKNEFLLELIAKLLYLYLRVVYFTSRWQFIFLNDSTKQEFLAKRGTIFTLWHNRLAFGPGIFHGHNDTYALISPHSDGEVISSIISQYGFGIIKGSTNKNPVGALKTIIQKLISGSNVVITPDGPRGPVYKINSSVTKIAMKYKIDIIPMSCTSSRYFLFKSWDKLIMPLPFSNIKVIIDDPLVLTPSEEQNNHNLEQRLMELTRILDVTC